jgi:hypothetical protein
MQKKATIKEAIKVELKNLPEIQPLTEKEKLALKGGLCCRDKRRPIRSY